MENFVYQRLYLRLNQGRTAAGKSYRVWHSDQLGFDCTVNINGKSMQIEYDEDDGTPYVNYVPRFAKLTVDDHGAKLSIVDPKDLK